MTSGPAAYPVWCGSTTIGHRGGTMDVEQTGREAEARPAGRVQAFLIADIRGYSTFTAQRGAAAAAHLATTFTDLSRDAIMARGGQVLGLRGDEVLAAFDSPGQAVRAALDIQFACAEATAAEPEFPLGVGAGMDFGEAVAVDDGYHGAAINMAARLCSQAAAGQVLVTATVRRRRGERVGPGLRDDGDGRAQGFRPSGRDVRGPLAARGRLVRQ